MAVRGRDQTPEQGQEGLRALLQRSVSAAGSGDHATSWRLTSEFGTRYWLADPGDLPPDLPAVERTEFHVLRAAAADRMELHDDAVDEVRLWRSRAEDAGDIPSAVLALSSLCLVAMVVECDDAVVTSGLAPSPALLTELAARVTDAGDLLTETGQEEDRHTRVCLSLAAMAGLTCATSTENIAMRRVFRRLTSRFTSETVQPGDRVLTEAQQLHADGRTSCAVDLVTTYLAGLDPQSCPTQAYEAHDLLGYFALTSGETPEDMDTVGVLTHWRECAELALELGAPLEGMHRAEQVCQLLNADGDYDAAHDLACRYSSALDGAPVSPALLNLNTVRARSALGRGRPDEAFALAAASADWSAMTPDTERTLACLSIATMAAEETAGTGATVVALLHRAAALHLDRDEPIQASQVLRTAARERCSVGETSRAVEFMERALRILDEVTVPDGDDMLTWHLADWNEDMSAVWEMADRPDLAVGYAERAARFFRDAQDHSGAALNWVSAAELYLDQGDGDACDLALDLAHAELLSVPVGDDTDPDTGGDAAWEGYHALRNLRQG